MVTRANLSQINEVARKIIMKNIVDGVYKASPLLAYLREGDLYSVYRKAEEYGYRSWRDNAG